MTAASYTTRLFAPPVRTTRRWTHFLALLGVCLPVPICAVSGISLPLPATVERIAASLVPWADGVAMSANEALRMGAAGSIVAETDERSGDSGARLAGVVTTAVTRTKDVGRVGIPLPGAVVPLLPGIPTVPGAPAPAAPDPGAGFAQPTDGGPTPSAPATPGESPAPAPGPAPTPSTEPAPPPAQSNPDPVAAVKPVVDEVLAPVTPILDETTKTVEEVIAPVLPVLPVLPGLGK
jgi:hypothetical protein